MGNTGDRPDGAIRIGDRIVVEVGGRSVEVIVRSLQARGQPDKLTGSLGFSASKDEDDQPEIPGMEA